LSNHCRDCKYSRFDESVLEVVCAVNLIKGLRDTVNSLPPLRTCSAFERKEQEASPIPPNVKTLGILGGIL